MPKNMEMNEKPILFSGPMVQAILAGRKTQTRRVVNWQNILKQTGCSKGTLAYSDTFNSWAVFDGNGDADIALLDCPYGKPCDRLWVRESGWQPKEPSVRDLRDGADTWPKYAYSADGISDVEKEQYKDWGWKSKPSIFMPRWASRITLEITGVRVERLQDISEEDAIAEGMNPETITHYRYVPGEAVQEPDYDITPLDDFIHLWSVINGKKHPWDSNPWVWVVEFKKI